jgi:hypothetical protein
MLRSLRQRGTDVREFACRFGEAAKGLGYNEVALKDLFNLALEKPLEEWWMRGLDCLTFGQFVEFVVDFSAAVPAHSAPEAAVPAHSAPEAAMPAHSALEAAVPAHSALEAAMPAHSALEAAVPAHGAPEAAVPALYPPEVAEDAAAALRSRKRRRRRKKASSAPQGQEATQELTAGQEAALPAPPKRLALPAPPKRQVSMSCVFFVSQMEHLGAAPLGEGSVTSPLVCPGGPPGVTVSLSEHVGIVVSFPM